MEASTAIPLLVVGVLVIAGGGLLVTLKPKFWSKLGFKPKPRTRSRVGAIRFCRNCGARIAEPGVRCPACRKPLRLPDMIRTEDVRCHQCGGPLFPGDPFCCYCGADQSNAAPGSPRPDDRAVILRIRKLQAEYESASYEAREWDDANRAEKAYREIRETAAEIGRSIHRREGEGGLNRVYSQLKPAEQWLVKKVWEDATGWRA